MRSFDEQLNELSAPTRVAFDIVNGLDEFFSHHWGSNMGPNEWDDYRYWANLQSLQDQQTIAAEIKTLIEALVPLTSIPANLAMKAVPPALKRLLGISTHGAYRQAGAVVLPGYHPIVSGIGTLVQMLRRLPDVDESPFFRTLLPQLPHNANPYVKQLVRDGMSQDGEECV